MTKSLQRTLAILATTFLLIALWCAWIFYSRSFALWVTWFGICLFLVCFYLLLVEVMKLGNQRDCGYDWAHDLVAQGFSIGAVFITATEQQKSFDFMEGVLDKIDEIDPNFVIDHYDEI